MIPGTEVPGRCRRCGFAPVEQGHRSSWEGLPTGCKDSGPLGLLLARDLRDQGMARAEDAHPGDAALVDEVLNRRIRRGGQWSLNDIRPELQHVKSRAVIGARVQAMARAGRIRRVGYVPSTEPGTHGHPVAVWTGRAA